MAVSKQAILKGAKKIDGLRNKEGEAPVNEESISRKDEASFTTAFISKEGMKDKNHNYFAFVESESYACWALADGHKESGKAAKLVVEEVLGQFLSEPSFSAKFLKKAVKSASKKLIEKQKDDESLREQITSMAVVISNYHSILVAYIGNIRIYHLANGLINYKTKDHSVAQLMFEADKMGEKDVRYHYRRDDLTKAIGKGNKVHVEKVPLALNDGDAILMSTIGAWENMEERELEVEYSKAHSANEWMINLEKRILSSGAKEINNYSLVGICAEETAEPQGKVKKKINYKLIGAIALVVIILSIFGFSAASKQKRKNEIYAKASQHEVLANENLKDSRFVESIEYLRKANTEYQKLVSQKVSKNKLIRTITGQEMMIQSTRKQMEGINEKIGKVDKLVKADVKLEEAKKLVAENDFAGALAIYEDVLVVYNNQNFSGDDEIIDRLTKEVTANVDIIKELNNAMEFKVEADKLYTEGDYEKSVSRYQDAKIVFLKHGKLDLVTEVNMRIENSSSVKGELSNNALVHENKGYDLEYDKPTEAIMHFEQAINLYRQLNNQTRVDSLNEKLIKVRERIAVDIQKADKYYQNALKYASQERFSDSLETFDKAKNIYLVNGEITKSKKMDTEIANLKKTMAKKANIQEAFDIEDRAGVMHIEKNYEEAKKLYMEAIALFRVNKFDTKVSEVERKVLQVDGNMLEAQADLAYSDKQLKGAIKLYEDSKAKYEAFGDQELIDRVAGKLQEVVYEDNFESAMGLEEEADGLYKSKKYEEALEKYKESKGYYESLEGYKVVEAGYDKILKTVDKKISKTERKIKDTPWMPW